MYSSWFEETELHTVRDRAKAQVKNWQRPNEGHHIIFIRRKEVYKLNQISDSRLPNRTACNAMGHGYPCVVLLLLCNFMSLAQTAASSLVDMPCNQHAVLRNNLVTSIQHSMWMHVTCACLRTSLQSIKYILFEKGLGGSTCLPLLLYFSKEFHWMSTTDWSLARLVTLDGVPDSSPKGPWPHRTTCHFQCHEVDASMNFTQPYLFTQEMNLFAFFLGFVPHISYGHSDSVSSCH